MFDRYEPRSVAEQLDQMESDVIKRGGSFDVPFDISRPSRPKLKPKKEKR